VATVTAAATDAVRVTREEFSASFDRCFGRVYAYVFRRVSERESCERIVGEVLAENLDLLMERGDDKHEFGRLKASSDRLIGLESAPHPRAVGGAGTGSESMK